ncbi:MAG: glycosyltransferase family 87 protein [Sphingomonadaceae bacterium]
MSNRFARIRSGDWLEPRTQRIVMIMLTIANVAVVVTLIATSHNGIDRNGNLLGADFLSFWTSGRMLHSGADPYSLSAHVAAQQAYYTTPGSFLGFFYPPLFLPICWVLGLFGYFIALPLWLATTGGGLLLTARDWSRRLSAIGPGWLAVAAFPPVLITLTHGQSSFLAAALLGLGTLLVGSQPWLAGAILGLAAFKPQLGLLVPIVLLASRQYRVIAGACLSVMTLAALVTAWLGPQVWTHWLGEGPIASAGLSKGLIGFAKFQSFYAGLRLIGLPNGLAMAFQIILSLGVAGWLAKLAWQKGWSLELGAAMLAGAVLATPFVLDYDLVLLAFPLILLASVPARPWEKTVAAMAFIMPQFARPLGELISVPIAPPILLALLIVLCRRVADQRVTASA